MLRLCKGLSKRTKVSRIGLAGATDVFRKHPDDDALGSWGEAVWGLGFGFRVSGFRVKCRFRGIGFNLSHNTFRV